GLDLGKADVGEVAPENIHRAGAENRLVVSSKPEELIALVFVRDPGSEDEIHARNLLTLSIDTAAVNNVVLQGGGEPTGALLPNWMSGYAFVFAAGENTEGVTQERMQAKHLPTWTRGYDASHKVERVMPERVPLYART